MGLSLCWQVAGLVARLGLTLFSRGPSDPTSRLEKGRGIVSCRGVRTQSCSGVPAGAPRSGSSRINARLFKYQYQYQSTRRQLNATSPAVHAMNTIATATSTKHFSVLIERDYMIGTIQSRRCSTVVSAHMDSRYTRTPDTTSPAKPKRTV